MDCNLQCWVNIASIATFFITVVGASVGVYGYFRYRSDWRVKRRTLEKYLRDQQEEKETGGDRGQRTTLHLVRHVGLTEDEIIQISFESSNIERRLVPDEAGYASALLFEYSNSNQADSGDGPMVER